MALPITVTQVGTRLGVNLANQADKAVVEAAIQDAVDDVEAYLGRAITPQTYVEQHRWPVWGGWELTPLDRPVRSITSAVPETVDGDPTGYYTVTYVAGMDCATERDKRPILRYLTAAVLSDPAVVRLWTRLRSDPRQVTGVNVEGQGVTFATPRQELGGGDAKPGSGEPGALPTLKSLDRWRRAGRRAYTRRGGEDSWPYGGPLFDSSAGI